VTPWLQLANVVAASIMAGGLVVVLVVVVPAFDTLPAQLSIRLHVGIDHYIERLLPPVTVVATLIAIAVLAVHDDLSTSVVALTAVGIAGGIVVAVVSHFVNRPMNGRIRAFPAGEAPPEYAEIRARWDHFHRIRTAAGVVSLACFVAALVVR